jgi:hypothetical protein
MAKHKHKHEVAEDMGVEDPALHEEIVEEANDEAVVPTSHREITIQGAVFLIPNRYAEGHVLTKGEADALNQTFAENIRNNVVARAKKAADTVAEGSEASVAITQELIDTYAAEYVFGVRKSTRKVDKNPVEVEERRLARQAVNDAIKRKGLKLKDIADETYEGYVTAAIATGRYRAQAEQIVAIKRGMSTGLDLDLD